jgi:DNA-binding GntR family transcriptional regulator
MGAGNGELESVRVTRLLRDDILRGRRLPGARLVERDIASELSVSRLPVREAIRTLVSEGIVVARPRSWATVREFTLRDVQDFAEVRKAIETQLFVLATQRHDDDGIEQLRRLVEREEHAASTGDVEEALTLSGAFHQYLTVLAGNEMLTELAGIFATRLKWVFGQHGELEAMAAEHRRLYDAIRARDVETVQVLVSAHLDQGAAAATQKLAARTAPIVVAEA